MSLFHVAFCHFLIKVEHLQDIMTSIECSDPFPKDVHRQCSTQHCNRNTPTSNEHVFRSSAGNPVIEEIREAEEHKVLERDCSDECLHWDGTISIEHVRETSVHVNQQCTDRESIKHCGDNVTLTSVDTKTESVETDTSEDDCWNSEEETKLGLRKSERDWCERSTS